VTFTYVVTDGNGGSDTGSVTVTVTPSGGNNPPLADDDTGSVDEDSSVIVDVIDGDTDADNDTLTVASIGTVTGGSASATAGSTSISVTPTADSTASVTFTYVVTDGNGGSDTGSVTVTVNAVNDPPVADDDTGNVAENGSVIIDVLDGDTDIDGGALTVASIGTVNNGSAVATAGSTSISVTPTADSTASVTFTYVVTDGNGGSDTGSVTVTVTPSGGNNPPVADDDTGSVDEDSSVIVDVIDGDTDADNDTLTVASIGTVTGGSASATAGSTSISVTPTADSTTSVTFTYVVTDGNGGSDTGSVTVTVNPVNDPPVADDDNGNVNEDSSVIVDVLDGDTDIDGGTLTVASIGTVTGGSASATAGSTSISVTPTADSTASVTFTYVVTDGNGGSDTGSVTVTVNAVNDPPVADDDAGNVAENGSVIIDVLDGDTDIDGGPLTVASIGAVNNGSAVATAGSTSISVTPTADSTASVTFTYVVTDGNGGSDTGSVTVTVNAADNNPPVADDDTGNVDEDNSVIVDVIDGDTDADNDTLLVDSIGTVTGGSASKTAGSTSISITPTGDSTASVTFTYVVTDGNGGSDTGSVTVTVNPVNDPPVADDDTGSVAEDGSVIIDVLDGDTDIDGGTLTVASIGTVTGGSASATAGSTSISVNPALNSTASVTFTYTVTDGNGGTDTANVTITVNAQNDPPVAENDSGSISGVPNVVVDVLSNDTDLDNDPLIIASITTPANGTAITTDSKVEYTPDSTFSGEEVFTYTVSDGNGGTATATITITVAAVPGVDADAPGGPKTGDPGDKVVHPVTVTNTGNSADILQLKPSSSLGWSIALYHDADGDGTLTSGDTLLTDTDNDNNVDTGNLAAGAALKLLVVPTVPVGTADAVADTTTLTVCSTNDPNKRDDVSLLTTVTAPSVQIVKNVTPTGSLPPGTVLTYSVTVTNNGSGQASNVRITDSLDSLLTYVTDSLRTGANSSGLTTRTDLLDGDNGYFHGDQKSVIAGGKGTTLSAGESLVLRFASTMLSGIAGSTLRNVASVNFSDGNGNALTAASAGVDVTIQGFPLLEVHKLPSSNPVGSGETLNYTIEYANKGNTTATGSRIRDQLASEVTFLASDPVTIASGAVYDADNHEVIFELGNVGGGQSGQVSFNVQVNIGVPDGTKVFNHANMESDQLPTLETSFVTVGRAPNLVINIARDIGIVTDEDEIKYLVDFSNTGNQDSTNTFVTVPVPTGTILIPSSVTGINASRSAVSASVGKVRRAAATINPTNTEITWNVGLLAQQGGNGKEGFQVQIPDGTPEGTVIPAQAAIQSDQVPQVVAKAVTSIVIAKVELNLEQTPNKTTASFGEKLTFTVDVDNGGDVDLTGIVVRIPIPSGTALVTLPAGGVQVGNEIVVNVGDLVVGAQTQFDFTVCVTGPLLNLAEVESNATALSNETPAINSRAAVNLVNDPAVITFVEPDGDPTNVFKENDPICIQVDDVSQNTNAATSQQITVTLANTTAGDSEAVTLTETGVNNGSFRGCINSTPLPGASGNGIFSIARDENMSVIYNDPDFPAVALQALAVVDPINRVMSTFDGSTVSNVTLTLVDNATSTPVNVTGNPTVSSGVGEFSFPSLPPGTYRLLVDAGSSFLYPSTVADASLPAGLVLGSGSRAQAFAITGTGGFLNFDVPLDPEAGRLRIVKTGNKNRASIGDLLGFTLQISNEGVTPMNSLIVRDLLPHGMEYVRGSSKLDGTAIVDPTMSSARNLQYGLGTINGAQSRTLEYVVVLSVGSKEGRVANRALASATHLGRAVSSLESRFVVDVSEGVFTDRGTLIGKVFLDLSGDGLQGCAYGYLPRKSQCLPEPGIGGAVLYLEDGTRVTTDKNGKYLVPAIEKGRHVIVLDRASIPGGLKPVPINNRSKGNTWSQFIFNEFGGISKANFALRGPGATLVLRTALMSQEDEEANWKELAGVKVDRKILPGSISLSVPADGIPADGRSLELIEVRANDESGSVIGVPVFATVELSSGTVLDEDVEPEIPGIQVLLEEGTGLLKIQAPFEAGDSKLRVLVNGAEQETQLRFKPHLRDRVLAAVGEIRFGNGNSRGNKELLAENDLLEDGSYTLGRGAFFLKDTIGSKTLITAAYDSAKKTRDDLFRTRESNQDRESKYPIHGDDSSVGYEAISQRKAYVKLERGMSSLLFGDYSAPLTDTNLSRYSRSLNGWRLDANKNSWNVDGFHSLTSRTLVVEELRGRGITGFYFLNQARMLEGSERVILETRRRERPDIVLDRVQKSRNTDYEIDYVLGAIKFKAPIPTVDPQLNPVFIVVTYESETFEQKLDLFGGRVSKKIGPRLNLGVTRVEEHQLAGDYELTGVDASLEIKKGLVLSYEKAKSEGLIQQNNTLSRLPGEATEMKLEGELLNGLEVDAYYRDAEPFFRNQSAYQVYSGTRKKGAKANYKLNSRTNLSGEFFLDRNNIDNHFFRHSSLGFTRSYEDTTLGFEWIDERSQDSFIPAGSNTFRGGFDIAAETPERFRGWRATLKRPINERLALSLSSKMDTRDQDYFLGHIGLDYQINPEQKLYLRQERARFDETRDQRMVFGAETSLTDNTSAFSEYRIGKDSDGTRTQKLIGIENRFSLRKGLRGDIRFETLDTTQGPELGHQPDGNSISVGMEHTSWEKLKTTLRLERRNGGSGDTRNIDIGMGYALSDTVKVLGKHRWIDNEFPNQGSQRSTRTLFGLAYRPVHHDRFNALAKAELRDGYSAATKPGDLFEAEIYSLDFHYQWRPNLQFAGRFAAKMTSEDGFGSHLSLTSARIIKDLNDRWDISYNFRILRGHDHPVRHDGHRFEVGYRMRKNLWTMLGYSLDEFDSDLTGDFYEGKGAYLGLKAKF
jgi:uncharacterized repeat protein (TIGR01451 family)